MKLKKLKEGTADLSFLDDISKSFAPHVKEYFEQLAQHFKFVEEHSDPNSDSNEKREFLFTNGFLDLSISIQGKTFKTSPFIILNGIVTVNSKYLVQPPNSNPDNVFVKFTDVISSAPDGKDILKSIGDFNSKVKEFIDWYFDITGEYGKVKLFRTQYNIINGYHKGDENRWVAYAGDFHTGADTGALSGDAANKKTEKRIF